MVKRRPASGNKGEIGKFETDRPVKKREISIKRGSIADNDDGLNTDTRANIDEQVKRKKISFSKINAQGPGLFSAQATSVEMIYDKNVTIGTQDTTRDVVKVEFELENGHKKSKEMILAMTEGSEIGRFVKAIKGEIPNHIEDFEKELLYKNLIVEIKENIKNEKTYYNIVGFHELNTPKKNTRYRSHEDSYNYNIPDEDEYEDDEYEDDEYEDDEYEDNEYEDDEYEDNEYEDDEYEDNEYEDDDDY